MNIRINKYIAESGTASRREADRLIEAGKVRVNGRLASLGDVVGPGDKVLVNGNPVSYGLQRVYLAYNKPEGVTSTTDKEDPDNIIKAVAYHGGRIFPIGRLDKDSEGLILLTNDGDIVNKILRVSNKHDKEYIVRVDQPITTDFVQKMSSGVSILGVMTRKCAVEKINTNTFRIILNQGLNRQIRRMCKVLGYKVLKLERIRIMNVSIQGIASGSWRFLTDAEIDGIMSEIKDSKSEGTARQRKSFSKSKAKRAGKFTSDRKEKKEFGSGDRGAVSRGKKEFGSGEQRAGSRGKKDLKVKGSGGRKSEAGTRGGGKKSGGRR
jgi:23S rRNA pseudouridine2604 synthase